MINGVVASGGTYCIFFQELIDSLEKFPGTSPVAGLSTRYISENNKNNGHSTVV